MTNKPLILLAEDDENLGNVIKDYLQICGYEIILAEEGEAAWRLYQTYTRISASSFTPPSDILTISLPKAVAIDLAREVLPTPGGP